MVVKASMKSNKHLQDYALSLLDRARTLATLYPEDRNAIDHGTANVSARKLCEPDATSRKNAMEGTEV
jgi:hypothetical protein